MTIAMETAAQLETPSDSRAYNLWKRTQESSEPLPRRCALFVSSRPEHCTAGAAGSKNDVHGAVDVLKGIVKWFQHGKGLTGRPETSSKSFGSIPYVADFFGLLVSVAVWVSSVTLVTA